jgi:hypothetical protein
MRNVSDRSCRDNPNTHFMFNNFCFENLAVYEITWQNIVERSRPQTVIWRMSIACWIPKATNVQTDCVIIITFPLQQWLHERASLLRYTFIACLLTFVYVLDLELTKDNCIILRCETSESGCENITISVAQ